MTILLYALAWFCFAAVHSILARPHIQQKLEGLVGRWYRSLYNLLALISIALVYFAGRHWLSTSPIQLLDNIIFGVVLNAIQVVGMLLLVIAFTYHDMGRFAGVTQLFTGERLTDSYAQPALREPLQRRGPNKWVRHPLYTGAFLVLWGGAISVFGIWTAVWGTLYLIIGTHFEEHKLLKIYADDYRRYQREVPCYFPRWAIVREDNPQA